KHLPGGFVGEREQQNVAWLDSVLEQVGDPIGKCACLSRAGAGDDKERSGRCGHRRQLLLIELRCVIDVDRCRSWCALERVLTRHGVWKEPQQASARKFPVIVAAAVLSGRIEISSQASAARDNASPARTGSYNARLSARSRYTIRIDRDHRARSIDNRP